MYVCSGSCPSSRADRHGNIGDYAGLGSEEKGVSSMIERSCVSCVCVQVVNPDKIKMFVLDEADVMIDQQGQQDQTIRIQR